MACVGEWSDWGGGGGMTTGWGDAGLCFGVGRVGWFGG